MKYGIGKACLVTLSIFMASGASWANVGKPDSTLKSSVISPTAKTENQGRGEKANVAALKGVDINSASKAELKALPGIDDARADKIISGRPYLSKAFLVTRNIIPAGVYQSIKNRIIARQK